MSKVVRVQEGDYKILLGKDGVPNNFIIDTNAGSFNGATGEVIIKGDLSVTGNAPSPEVTNVLYVTVDGDDANSGRGEGPGQAKRSIKAAVAAAQEGTTIFVRSGEYYEDNPIRLPPKVSIIGDNLRRTILRPLNGPRKFSATSVQRTNTVVTVETDAPHDFKLHDRVRVIIPNPASPNDRTTHILDTECANITEIVDETTFKYIDPNFTDIPFTTTTIGTVEQGIDFFLVTNQSYIAQLVFRGFQAPGYCLNIDRDAIVDTSPYIQNCSNINGPWLRNGTEWLPFITEQPNLAGEMVKGPRPLRDDEIDPAQVDQYGINERGAGGGMLIDGDRYNPESPLKSMVADAFTQVAQGAVGFHITNFGYMQLVSCFSVFCDKAFYTTNGGYLSISNSVIDFGNYGFLADGFYPVPYATGLVTQDYTSKVGSITLDREGSGYFTVPNAIIEPPYSGTTAWSSSTAVVLDTILTSGSNFYKVVVAGTTGLVAPSHTTGTLLNGTAQLKYVGTQATAIVNIDSIRGTINAITPDNQGNGYTFVPTITIDAPPVGTRALATVNLATNTSITVSQLSEKPQVGSILFVGDDPIGYYIKSTANSNLGFRFNELKCRRDVKYIVDAVLSDAIFNTNFRTLYSARAYLRSYSSKVLSLQKAQTINALMVARDDVIDQLLSAPGGLASATPFTATGDNRSVTQIITDLFNLVLTVIYPDFLDGDGEGPFSPGDPVAEPVVVGNPVTPANLLTSVPDPNPEPISLPAPTTRTAGFVEAGNILEANKEYIKDQVVKYINDLYKGFVYNSETCRRDIGLIVDAVSYDLITGSNFASIVAGSAYQRAQASGVTGGQLPQTLDAIRHARDLTATYVEGSIQFKVVESFNNVLNILANGIGNAPGLVFPDNGNALVNTDASADSDTLRSNINTYKISVSSWLANPANGFSATWAALGVDGQATCQRDIGYVVNAVSYDLLYGGNYQSVIAGDAYFSFGTLQIDPSEESITLAAYNYLRTLMQADVPNSAGFIDLRIDDITGIILNNGVLPVIEYPSALGENEVIQLGFDNIQANKSIVQNSTIEYIDNTYNSLGYNETKCARDIGIIVEAVFDDLVFGSNYRSKTAGLSYLRSYSGKVTDKQKVPTIAGIERARDLVLKYIKDELDSEVTIRSLFDTVRDIIRKENYVDVPPTFYTTPYDGVEFNARTIEQNKNDIIEQVIDFINEDLNPAAIVNYDERTCRRDLNYILEALVFDILYGGNSATLNVARSFFTEGGQNVVSTQIPEHVDAFNFLKGFVGTAGSDLLDIIINAIEGGLTTLPALDNPSYTRGSLNQYYVGVKEKILGGNLVPALLPSIQTDVVKYINDNFRLNFDYNEATCRRDIEYIIDALRYDLTYGGNTQTTNAALAYSEGSVIAGEINETVAAYKYWKEILPYILQNIPVPNSIAGQVFTVPSGDPIPAYYPGFIAQNLLQIVIDALDYGPGYVPEPVTESDFSAGAGNAIISFKSNILDNISGIQDKVITYLNTIYGGNIDVELFPGVIDIAEGTEVKFHNVSTISTGGTALEYVGSGVTYNALPFFGGEPIPEQERTEINNGRCFTVTNDQVGNFRVGSLFAVDALTGGVTIDANNVSLSGIGSIGPFLRNGIPVGVELQEVSNNPALISSLGTQDVNTVPTQFAVSTYVENRYLNKVQDTTPQTVESEVAFQNNVIIEGNLTVNGLTTTIESTSLVVEDPNITIGKDNTTDAQANGGGITLKGATDKTINWIDANDAWTFSEHVDLANTKVYRINNTNVLSSTAVLDVPTTVTAFSAATSLTMGATTGTATIRNASTVLTGDLEVRGGDLTTNQSSFNLLNTNATTVNAFNVATAITIGANNAGTLTVRNSNTVLAGDLEVRGGDIVTDQTTFNLLNTNATTVNAFGAATLIEIGSATGTTNVNNNLDVDGDINIDGGDLTVSTTTFNLANTTATTVNAFGAATNLSIGALTGTLTVRNQQTVFSSTDSIRIPVGTTAERDATPEVGQIRYNTTLTSFEGFGPGNAWGTLGGVRDVDGNTYIIPELTPGNNDNTLWFYNNGVQTLTITQTDFDLKSPVRMTINNTTNSTSSTTGALVVAGGVGVANDIVGAGWTISSIQQFEIDEGEY